MSLAHGSGSTSMPQFHRQLVAELSKIDRPGDFVTSRSVPVILPGLEVDQVGTIALPLPAVQAKQLIKCCTQAPYGKGTETLVDTKVRNVWELDPQHFKLTNAKWQPYVDSIAAEAQSALGITQAKLRPSLYKLLVYEKGSFFLPHQDGEKLDGMVATLVITLPSIHEGGELIVRHDNRTVTIPFSEAAAGEQINYAAFYADCEHEVSPVRKGYRLSLVYNLAVSKPSSRLQVQAPNYQTTTNAVADLMRRWQAEPEPGKMAVLLEHEYTQDGLALGRLKGVDRPRAETLLTAAEQADCVAHLALLTFWQSGYGEPLDQPRRRSRWYEYDAEEEDSADPPSYEMIELYDWGLTANHWTDREGQRVNFGKLPIAEDEVISDKPLDEQTPSKENFEGYTGNAGMTLERWYHRAAIVIWPRREQMKTTLSCGTDAAVGMLQVMLKRENMASGNTRGRKRRLKTADTQQREELVTFASEILRHWEPPTDWAVLSRRRDSDFDPQAIVDVLFDLDEPALIRKALETAFVKDPGVTFDDRLFDFTKRHGWEDVAEGLTRAFGSTQAMTATRNLDLLERIVARRDQDRARQELAQQLSGVLVAQLASVLTVDSYGWLHESNKEPDQRLAKLIQVLVKCQADAALGELVEKLQVRVKKRKDELERVQLVAIDHLKSKWSKWKPFPTAIVQWLENCLQELNQRVAKEPRPPKNYRRSGKLRCSCTDCVAITKFLSDPSQQQLRLPRSKEYRRHLHDSIESAGVDLKHETERRGRPFTLVLTKTTDSFEKRKQNYDRHQSQLADLKSVLARLSPVST